MRLTPAALAIVLAGCNAVFGLDEPSGRDGDAGADADANADADPDAVAPTMAGYVSAIGIDYVTPMGAVDSFQLDAQFGVPVRTCQELDRIGGCIIASCVDGLPVARADAGEIVFTSEQSPTLVPASDGNYTASVGTGRLFAADGGLLHVTAAGGAVPAFTSDVAIPTSVTFSTVLPSAGATPVTYARAAGLNVQWSGGSGNYVGVGINSDSGGVVLRCSFPTTAGSGLIDAALLTMLPAGPGTLSTAVTGYQLVTVDVYLIQVAASVVGKHSDGNWATGHIMLQ